MNSLQKKREEILQCLLFALFERPCVPAPCCVPGMASKIASYANIHCLSVPPKLIFRDRALKDAVQRFEDSFFYITNDLAKGIGDK